MITTPKANAGEPDEAAARRASGFVSRMCVTLITMRMDMKLRLNLPVIACLLTCSYAQANDFPTEARVEYVLQCMNNHGGQTYNTLYACVCAIDAIAARLSYADYTEAETFTMLRKTPGERGAVFRDPERSGQLIELLAETSREAEHGCLLREQQAHMPSRQ